MKIKLSQLINMTIPLIKILEHRNLSAKLSYIIGKNMAFINSEKILYDNFAKDFYVKNNAKEIQPNVLQLDQDNTELLLKWKKEEQDFLNTEVDISKMEKIPFNLLSDINGVDFYHILSIIYEPELETELVTNPEK